MDEPILTPIACLLQGGPIDGLRFKLNMFDPMFKARVLSMDASKRFEITYEFSSMIVTESGELLYMFEHMLTVQTHADKSP